MKPFEEIDRHTAADGTVLRFMHRDGDYWILIDGEELMATRATHSEGELARLTCSGLTGKRPRVLIGGLGLGFTLRAALDVVPPSTEVVVAEVFESVVRWNFEHLPNLQGDALRDRRLVIACCDVWDAIAGSLGRSTWVAGARLPPPEDGVPRSDRSGFDVILLDVDNGPAATCLEDNARLYGFRGLDRIHDALRPDGQLAVWATDPDKNFEERLYRAGFEVHTETVRSRGDRGTRHFLFLARKGEKPPSRHRGESRNRGRSGHRGRRRR